MGDVDLILKGHKNKKDDSMAPVIWLEEDSYLCLFLNDAQCPLSLWDHSVLLSLLTTVGVSGAKVRTAALFLKPAVSGLLSLLDGIPDSRWGFPCLLGWLRPSIWEDLPSAHCHSFRVNQRGYWVSNYFGTCSLSSVLLTGNEQLQCPQWFRGRPDSTENISSLSASFLLPKCRARSYHWVSRVWPPKQNHTKTKQNKTQNPQNNKSAILFWFSL